MVVGMVSILAGKERPYSSSLFFILFTALLSVHLAYGLYPSLNILQLEMKE
jgi:hypothetical protein